jgi:aryl-alcohol dehydrogenase-like predicted oxidoreductase
MKHMTNLPTSELGSTGLQISRIGFGAWAIGGPNWENGWGHQDDEVSIAAIHRALDLGINWIDTAPVYGFGHSEEVVGKALVGRADRPLIFTKAGLVEGAGRKEAHCLKRDSIRREIEDSLSRLGVDSIDLYQIHWPLPEDDISEAWTTFKELKDEGMVRHIGVSNFSVEEMRQLESIAPVETAQPPYSLIDRAAESELLPYCEQQGIGTIVYSPMASGLLSGRMSPERMESLPDNDWRKRDPAFREPALARSLSTADRVVALAAELGVSPGSVAVAWTLRNPAVDGAIVGFRRPEQIDDLVDGADLELGDASAHTLLNGRKELDAR